MSPLTPQAGPLWCEGAPVRPHRCWARALRTPSAAPAPGSSAAVVRPVRAARPSCAGNPVLRPSAPLRAVSEPAGQRRTATSGANPAEGDSSSSRLWPQSGRRTADWPAFSAASDRLCELLTKEVPEPHPEGAHPLGCGPSISSACNFKKVKPIEKLKLGDTHSPFT